MAKIQDGTNLYTSNKLIVDAAGTTPFTTIASAITAAVGLGQPTTIYIRPGTYTENLTLIDTVSFIGANAGTTTIVGKHTIPAAGYFKMQNLTLSQPTPANHIFIEAGAGTCGMQLSNCIFNINSGMIFNLPLSTGTISVEMCGDRSTQNSVINNTTGASAFYVSDSTIGVGAVSALIAGTTAFEKSTIGVPCTFSSASAAVITFCTITKEFTLSDTGSVAIYHSRFTTGAAPAMTIGATAIAGLNGVVISSSAANVVTGTGSCSYGDVTFIGASSAHNVTTEVYVSRTLSGSLQLGKTNAGVMYSTAGVVDSTAALTDGQLIIGKTGNVPSVATLSAGAGITIDNTTP